MPSKEVIKNKLKEQKDRLQKVFDIPFLYFEFLKEENSDLFSRCFEITGPEGSMFDAETKEYIKELNDLVDEAICAKETQQRVWGDIGTKIELLNKFKDHAKNGCADKTCTEVNKVSVLNSHCLKKLGTTREDLIKTCSEAQLYIDKLARDPNSIVEINK